MIRAAIKSMMNLMRKSSAAVRLPLLPALLAGLMVAGARGQVQTPPSGGAAAAAPAVAPVMREPAAPVASTIMPPPAPSWSRLNPLSDVPEWRKLADFNQTMTRVEFETALKEIYSDGSALPPPWKVTTEGVEVQTGAADMPVVKITFHDGSPNTPQPPPPPKYWRAARELPPLKDRLPLSDMHIALDPGHIGGTYARMEERFLSFHPAEAVQEGDLALAVAQELKPRLEALGAHVRLVREKNEPVTTARPEEMRAIATQVLKDAGIAAPRPTYDGLTGDAKIPTIQWQSEKLFYRVSEIRARAKKVNEEIRPDLVLCLHFNAESWGEAAQPQFSPVNHFHVLVNGHYELPELQFQDVRHELFERHFARIHVEELPLATALAEGVSAATGLPPYTYTTANAHRAGAGRYVFARNLLANRLYRCPVVYLEPFVMNHEETYNRLLRGHYIGRTLVGDALVSSPLEDYVRGVVRGLAAYYRQHRVP